MQWIYTVWGGLSCDSPFMETSTERRDLHRSAKTADESHVVLCVHLCGRACVHTLFPVAPVWRYAPSLCYWMHRGTGLQGWRTKSWYWHTCRHKHNTNQMHLRTYKVVTFIKCIWRSHAWQHCSNSFKCIWRHFCNWSCANLAIPPGVDAV